MYVGKSKPRGRHTPALKPTSDTEAGEGGATKALMELTKRMMMQIKELPLCSIVDDQAMRDEDVISALAQREGKKVTVRFHNLVDGDTGVERKCTGTCAKRGDDKFEVRRSSHSRYIFPNALYVVTSVSDMARSASRTDSRSPSRDPHQPPAEATAAQQNVAATLPAAQQANQPNNTPVAQGTPPTTQGIMVNTTAPTAANAIVVTATPTATSAPTVTMTPHVAITTQDASPWVELLRMQEANTARMMAMQEAATQRQHDRDEAAAERQSLLTAAILKMTSGTVSPTSDNPQAPPVHPGQDVASFLQLSDALRGHDNPVWRLAPGISLPRFIPEKFLIVSIPHLLYQEEPATGNMVRVPRGHAISKYRMTLPGAKLSFPNLVAYKTAQPNKPRGKEDFDMDPTAGVRAQLERAERMFESALSRLDQAANLPTTKSEWLEYIDHGAMVLELYATLANGFKKGGGRVATSYSVHITTLGKYDPTKLWNASSDSSADPFRKL
jgi:hypothetical protein